MTGSGTLADPYVIWDVNDLQNMNLDLAAYYELGQDIDASVTATWNQLIDRGAWAPFTAYNVNDFVTHAGNKYYCNRTHVSGAGFVVGYNWIRTTRLNAGDYLGFKGIGYAIPTSSPFIGHLDGENYRVSDLVMNLETYSSLRLALFDENQGVIKNLILINCSITGSSVDFNAGVSPLVNYNNQGIIENCHVSGIILATCSLPSTFPFPWATGFVQFNDGIIQNCFSSCIVTAIGDEGAEADGFVSENFGTISRCYSTANVTAQTSGAFDAEAQGFIFWNHGYTFGGTVYTALIRDSYARGNVTAISAAGGEHASGFVDENSNDGTTRSTISNCYSTSPLTGSTKNGFCRVNGGDIRASFWDIDSSGTLISDGGTGIATSQMKTQDNYTAAGWDFASIWDISRVSTENANIIRAESARLNGLLNVTIMNDLYPILQWQIPLGSPCDCGFEWGETPAFGNFTSLESKNSNGIFAQKLFGLNPNTTYYFRARASSSGPIYGGTKSFTTLALALEVETLPATNITENSARIWGRVRKVPITAMGRFNWGGSIEYGVQTPWEPGLVSDDMFYFDLNNLAEGRAYHYRAMGMGGGAVVYGNDMTFTTRTPLGPVTLIQEELAHIMEVA